MLEMKVDPEWRPYAAPAYKEISRYYTKQECTRYIAQTLIYGTAAPRSCAVRVGRQDRPFWTTQT
eukprot:5249057-Pleurochrysis_carterae.AAC.1